MNASLNTYLDGEGRRGLLWGLMTLATRPPPRRVFTLEHHGRALAADEWEWLIARGEVAKAAELAAAYLTGVFVMWARAAIEDAATAAALEALADRQPSTRTGEPLDP